MTNRHIARLKEIKNKKVILIKKAEVKIEPVIVEKEPEFIKEIEKKIEPTKSYKKTYKKKAKKEKKDYGNEYFNLFNKDK